MKYTNIALTGLLAIFSLSSCLKDTAWEEQKYGLRIEDLETKKIVEVAGIPTAKNLPVLTDEAVKEVQLFSLNLASKEVAQEDIVVTLEANHTGLSPKVTKFALSDISLPQSVVIKKGERMAPVMAKITTKTLSAEAQYVNVAIKSVSQPGYTISGNHGNMTLNLLQKSVYEGTYRFEVLENTAYPQYNVYIKQGDEDYYLSTVSSTTVNGIALLGVFNDTFNITFDSATNLVTKVEWVDWNVWSLVPGSSKYDQTTKTYEFAITFSGKVLRYKLTRLD